MDRSSQFTLFLKAEIDDVSVTFCGRVNCVHCITGHVCSFVSVSRLTVNTASEMTLTLPLHAVKFYTLTHSLRQIKQKSPAVVIYAQLS